MEYHPGVFLHKWTCCDSKEKSAQGCKESFAALERNVSQGMFTHYTVLLGMYSSTAKAVCLIVC